MAQPVRFTLLVVIQFIFSTCFMFYKKEFLKVVPYPFFLAFTNAIVGVPIAFLLAWGSHKFTTSFRFIVPPAALTPWLCASAGLQGIGAIVNNIGFFASDLDFVILMRFSVLIWNGILGFSVLGERLSVLGFASILIVAVGILLIVSDFQWSTAQMPSAAQFAVQSASMLLISLDSLVMRRSMQIIAAQVGRTFQILDYLVWVTLFSLPPTFVFWLWRERTSWEAAANIVTLPVVLWTLFGAVLHQAVHVVLAQLHKITTMISMGVIFELRLVGSLIASYFVYKQTIWNAGKCGGVALLVAGGIIYSITRIAAADAPPRRPREADAPLVLTSAAFCTADRPNA
jgi:drug/metabolite transporter (DMT)-like permease